MTDLGEAVGRVLFEFEFVRLTAIWERIILKARMNDAIQRQLTRGFERSLGFLRRRMGVSSRRPINHMRTDRSHTSKQHGKLALKMTKRTNDLVEKIDRDAVRYRDVDSSAHRGAQGQRCKSNRVEREREREGREWQEGSEGRLSRSFLVHAVTFSPATTQ